MNILKKIESRQATVAVIGLGYVGLPLAVAFAEAGFRVVGIDVDRSRVLSVNRGESYIQDVPSPALARLTRENPLAAIGAAAGAAAATTPPGPLPGPPEDQRQLSATTDFDALHQADAAIICVPTPLSKTKEPDMSYIQAATEEISMRLHQDMLVILESTTFPGTTEEIVLAQLREGRNQDLIVGRDFYLAFSPERVDPGNIQWTIPETPKVIGGVTPACLEASQALYRCAVRHTVPVSSPGVAEMVKLLENTFRATNIALVNEVAIMCDRLGVDVWEVIDAAKTKPFGFMPFYPGPGLGGHCIPVDPQFLAWKLKTVDYDARFIQLAAEINLGMPEFVLGKIADALNGQKKPVNGSSVLVLGVTYKANVGDVRESPALDLISLLLGKGAKVSFHDPFVERLESDDFSIEGLPLDEASLRQADCTVIITAHDTYDWHWTVANSRLIVDTRNATKGVPPGACNVVKL